MNALMDGRFPSEYHHFSFCFIAFHRFSSLFIAFHRFL